MQVIPAIDLRGGKCVRLRQGDYAKETVFSDDPVGVAQNWAAQGATYLHLVDLDGARAGHPVNSEVIEAIVRESGLPCQVGGGLRDEASVQQALKLGCNRVILGTKALRNPAEFSRIASAFPGKVVLGLDARDGQVAVEGWSQTSHVLAFEVLDRVRELPLAAIVYTDIAKDGMMEGPNVSMTSAIATRSPHLVIASGGIATVEHIMELAQNGVGACILGRALYEGKVKLPELLKYIHRGDGKVSQDA